MNEKYLGKVKKAIKFDDTNQSLCLDVKLPHIDSWERIRRDEMYEIMRRRDAVYSMEALRKSGRPISNARRDVFMIAGEPELVEVDDASQDEEEVDQVSGGSSSAPDPGGASGASIRQGGSRQQ